MRKSNVVIVTIIIVASIIFLWLWFYLGFNHVDNPFDLVLSIIWWMLVLIICLIIHYVEKRRQRAIRTIYLAPNFIYNTETGLMRLDDDDLYVPLMQTVLNGLEYNFAKKDSKEFEKLYPDFDLIVHTDKYADKGDTWKGEIVETYNANNKYEFKNMDELRALIDKR